MKRLKLLGDALRTIFSVDTWRWQFRMWEYYARYNTGAIRKLGACGKRTHIEPTAKLTDPERIFIGSDCHINHLVCIQPGSANIYIGDDLRCGPGTMMFATNYQLGSQLVRESPFVAGDISIGNDVWLGAGVVITAGVTIGDHAVIAAGAVVTKNIPAGVIAGGIPAKVLGKRPGMEQINQAEHAAQLEALSS